MQVNIDSENVIKAFKNADTKGQQLLKDLVNGQVDFNMSIIDRTPTVEAALAIAGKTIEGLTRPTDSKHETALRILEAVIEVLNEGVKVDHSNEDQTKYEPYFIHKPGLGLSYDDCDGWDAHSFCGPRLCYLKYDVMLHGIKILSKQYNDYLN